MPLELYSSKMGNRNSNMSRTLHQSQCKRKRDRPAHFSFRQIVKDIERGLVPFTVSHRILMIVRQNSKVISVHKPGYLEKGLINEHNFGYKNSSVFKVLKIVKARLNQLLYLGVLRVATILVAFRHQRNPQNFRVPPLMTP
jgi:hypothetical protein